MGRPRESYLAYAILQQYIDSLAVSTMHIARLVTHVTA